MLQENEEAPDFFLADQDGENHRLSDYRGRTVILYFYPKDDTSGCTRQACGIRDRIEEIEAGGALVLGISPDSTASHRKFADKHGLPFTLLSDPDHAVAERYGVWQEKSLYGRKYFGIVRTTFVIGPDGRIQTVLHKVRPAAHAGQVLELIG